MLSVTLYSRPGCHLCEEVEAQLEALQAEAPHKLTVVNIDQHPSLRKKYLEQIPVLEVGPYTIKAPVEPLDLRITLLSAQRGQELRQEIDPASQGGFVPETATWTGADRFSYWLSKHYLAVLNLLVILYVGLPFLAPVLERAGASGPARVIYGAYGYACHQLAFRSMFLFGEQPFYPRESAQVDGLVPYEQVVDPSLLDQWAARSFVGNEQIGYKVALCERDVAIYAAILIFGLAFAGLRLLPFMRSSTSQILPSLPWYLWVLLALVPIGLDGVSQLLSQLPPPYNIFPIPYRESTPFLRTLTGGMFGFFSAWFGYAMVEETMVESRQYLESKLRYLQARRAPGVGNTDGGPD